MKNTRKKMLLSSVAMLLVALVALGSATFAWYFTNNSVTASETKLKASSADGLVIRKLKTDQWATKITNLKKFEDTNVSPATIDYSVNYEQVKGIVGAKGKANDDGTYTTQGTEVEHASMESNGAFLIDDFYVATPSSEQKDVKLTINGSANENTYINVAVYVDDVLIGAVCSDGTTGQTNNRVQILANHQENGTYTLGTLNTTLEKQFKVKSNSNNGDGSHVQLIAFADGENEKCTTDKANTSEVNFTYEFEVA